MRPPADIAADLDVLADKGRYENDPRQVSAKTLREAAEAIRLLAKANVLLDKERRDWMGEALNSGDGTYRP